MPCLKNNSQDFAIKNWPKVTMVSDYKMDEKLGQSRQNVLKQNKFCQNRLVKIDKVFDPFHDTIILIKEQRISVNSTT